MSFVLLVFSGNNQISPQWYEWKVRASMGQYTKEVTHWAECTREERLLLLLSSITDIETPFIYSCKVNNRCPPIFVFVLVGLGLKERENGGKLPRVP